MRVQGNHSPAGAWGSAPTSNSRFLLHLALITVANARKRLFVLAADLFAVDFANAAGQRAGAGEENLVRIHHP